MTSKLLPAPGRLGMPGSVRGRRPRVSVAGSAAAKSTAGLEVPWHLLPRIALLLTLTVVAWGDVLLHVVESVMAGSHVAYLIVLPVLMAMIVIGCSERPRGVADGEVDWILASAVCGLATLLAFLVELRLPTMASLWHLELVGVVIWVGLLSVILFGARRAAVEWPMWLFAVLTATPLPYLLIVGLLGGSPLAYSAAAALIGAVAVFLAGRHRRSGWRLIVALGCAAVGIGVAAASSSGPLVVSVVLAGGVVPVASAVALKVLEGSEPGAAGYGTTPLPRRSPWSMLFMAGVAALVGILHPAPAVASDVAELTEADWATRMGLVPAEHFTFIERYLGSDATFVRYVIPPSQPGTPQAAVDVITSSNLAALDTLADVIWYPVQTVPEYIPVDVQNPAMSRARIAATDLTVSTGPEADNWCAVTWVWRTASGYQQVFVVVNQDAQSPVSPPAPQPLSLRSAFVRPIMWIARQQANPAADIDPVVAGRLREVVDKILAAGVSANA